MEEPTSPISVEQLLAHRAWVRDLARAIVGDEHEADDLAQEAWVRALGSPPAHPGAVRAWFRRVVGNLWRNRLRSQKRRAVRERAAARPEASDLARGAVERAETHRRLVAAVLDLDSPYRETLLLRYFEGLSPKEISLRSGIPSATVRSRAARGLALLRERFDRDGGGPGRWRSLVLPLLAPRNGRGGPPGLAATGGLLVMSGKTKIAIAALVIALLGAGAVTLSVLEERREPAPERTVAEVPEARPEAPEEPGAVETPATEERAGKAARPAGREFRVTVRGPDGEPVPGATVVVLSIHKPHGLRGSPEPGEPAGTVLGEFRTGDDGRVSLHAEAKERALPPNVVSDFRSGIRLKAEKDGLVAWGPKIGTEDGAPVALDLVLARAVALRGRVLDQDGAPIAGAVVGLMLRVGEHGNGMERVTACATGPDGSFHLDDVPEGQARARLVAAAEGFLSRGVPIDFGRDPAGGIEVVLSKGLSARGRCVDEGGEPLAGVLVRYAYGHVYTDRDGLFEISVVDPRRPAVRFVAPGREEKTVKLLTTGPQPQDLGDVALAAGLEIRGVVVSKDGAPMAGAGVTLTGQDTYLSRFYRSAKTGEDGSFAFPDLAPGEYFVSARGGPVHGSSSAALTISRKVTAGDEPVRLVLTPDGSVLVSFFDAAERKPLAVDSLRLTIWSGGRLAPGGMSMSGGAGPVARIRPAEPGTYTLTVHAKGYETVEVEGVEVRSDCETQVEVVLRPAR